MDPIVVGGSALQGRPSARVVAAEWAGLACAAALAVFEAPNANWDFPLLLSLMVFASVSDAIAVKAPAGVKISGSLVALVLAMVFMGGVPAAAVALCAIGVGWVTSPYPRHDLLINAVNYAWFPLVGGVLFRYLQEGTQVGPSDGAFYLLALGVLAVALAINFAIGLAYTSYVEDSPFLYVARKALRPAVSSELFAALLTVGVAYLYYRVGITAIALCAIALFTVQHLLGQLLLSEERAETLETRTHELHARTKQLATLQVGVLSALMHTLDLRDRMTARHSAAVARYSREIAAEAGCSQEEQDLVHTAGLLHDIGKFIFPDSILKGDTPLTDEDWKIIRMHPYQGAKIVADVDGYGPVGDIILAHHERIDGRGYPRGLCGDAIPKLSRMIAVADTYDVMTARDSYRKPMSSFEAIQELKRVAGKQLDAQYVDLFVQVLAGKDVRFRHGEDADFDAELGLQKRIDDYSALTREELEELAAVSQNGEAEAEELDVAVGDDSSGRRSLVKRLTGAGKDETPVT